MRARHLAAPAAVVSALILWSASGCGPAPEPSAAPNQAYVQRISASEVDNWRGVNYDGIVLDVRTPVEWEAGLVPLPSSVFISAAEINARAPEIDSYAMKPVLIVDRMGENAVSVAQFLVNRGFRNVTALDGGLQAYRTLYPESR
jgi:rhodanese-related sulfurtransferase